MWLAPAVALVGLFAPTVSADVTEDCSVCGCLDCNDNGVDDRCDVACSNSGTYCDGTPPQAASAVCNSGFFPSCATSFDCNANGVPDECDLASGASCDADLNTVPDECEFQIPANVLFVEDDAPPGGDGATWCTAFQSLQDALAASVAGDVIRIAQGTYLPVDCAQWCGSGDRTATFNLKNGVTIQGGYAGLGAQDPNARDISANETILSGDLLGDDVVLTNNYVINNLENVFHVMTAVSVDSTAVLDGITIRGGLADGTGTDKLGAGMFVSLSTPTIVNCTFTENRTSVEFEGNAKGGGMYSGFSAPTLDHCVFRNNRSNRGGGMFIFDIYNQEVSPTVTNCTFIANTAEPENNGEPTTTFGGGAYVFGSSPEFINCKFLLNISKEGGGGLCNAGGSRTRVINCVFSGNRAYKGGGAGNRGQSDTLFINRTFSKNCATMSGSTFYNKDSSPKISNSILANPASGCKPNIEGLDITDTELFKFSLASDPSFVDAMGADGIAGTEDDDLRLDTGSPAIDSGDNAAVLGITCNLNADCVAEGFQTCTNNICDGSVIDTDLVGNPRIAGGGGGTATVDIGAIEVQIDCSNGVCDPGESPCTCPGPGECGPPASTEGPGSTCYDGLDNDCNGDTDCADLGCAAEELCSGPPPPPD